MSDSRSNPIWHKGSGGPVAQDWVTRFTVGDDPLWDQMLLPFDAAASLAHAAGLMNAGVITEDELDELAAGLQEIGQAWERGDVVVTVEDEDCHTVIERLLTEKSPEAGRKIHTGRSRNDQVIAALRLWLRAHLDETTFALADLAEALADVADDNRETFLPGYTHMQRAMPSTVAAWALGYAEMLCDDMSILAQARDLNNASPLGSAAGYGVPYLNLDREALAEDLGFERVQENVTSIQLSRGKFELAAVHALVQAAATINRLASDIILYSTSEFDFVRLADGLTTGSSIMPQKKNPDIAELARASLHRIAAEMHVLLGVPANLPSGYHRDLQITKASVMKSVLLMLDLSQAATGLVNGLSFHAEGIEKARSSDLFATAAAMERVAGGDAFRTAYRDVAGRDDLWEEQSDRPVSDVYTTHGNPGQTSSDTVRERLDAIRGE